MLQPLLGRQSSTGPSQQIPSLGSGGLPSQSGSIVTPLLAGIATLSFIASLLALFGWLVPAHWFTPLIVAASIASVLLYILYFGVFSLLPIALDAILLWGILSQGWAVAGLK